MNDSIRLRQLCDSIASLTPESDSYGLSLRSLEALQRMVQSKIQASSEDQPEYLRELRQAVSTPTTEATHFHTIAQLDAFKQGMRDRLDGRSMTAFGDERDEDGNLTDAYCSGYDPFDTLELTKPEFIEHGKLEVSRYMAEIGVALRAALPQTSCDFKEDSIRHQSNGVLLLNLLNTISVTKPGFDTALDAIRTAMSVQGMFAQPLDPIAKSAIELLVYIRNEGFMSNDLGESKDIIQKIDNFDALLKASPA
jgi:hypothetical protein